MKSIPGTTGLSPGFWQSLTLVSTEIVCRLACFSAWPRTPQRLVCVGYTVLERPPGSNELFWGRQRFDTTVNPMTAAPLHCSTAVPRPGRKRLHARDISDGGRSASIGAQDAPSGTRVAARINTSVFGARRGPLAWSRVLAYWRAPRMKSPPGEERARGKIEENA